MLSAMMRMIVVVPIVLLVLVSTNVTVLGLNPTTGPSSLSSSSLPRSAHDDYIGQSPNINDRNDLLLSSPFPNLLIGSRSRLGRKRTRRLRSTSLYYGRHDSGDEGGSADRNNNRKDTTSSHDSANNKDTEDARKNQRKTVGYAPVTFATKHNYDGSGGGGSRTESVSSMDLHHLEIDNLKQNIESWWRNQYQEQLQPQKNDDIPRKKMYLESRPVWLNSLDRNGKYRGAATTTTTTTTNILTALSPSKILQDGLDQILATQSYPLFPTEWSRSKFDFDYRELLLKTVPTKDIVALSKTGRTEDTFHPLCIRVVLQVGEEGIEEEAAVRDEFEQRVELETEWEILSGLQFVVPIVGNIKLVELNECMIHHNDLRDLENPLTRLPEHDMLSMIQTNNNNKKNMKNLGNGVIREASEIEEDEVELLNQISKDLAQRVDEYNQFNNDDTDDGTNNNDGMEDNDEMKSITYFLQGSCFSRPTGTVSQRYLSHYDDASVETTTNNERLSCTVALVLGTGLHVPFGVD